MNKKYLIALAGLLQLGINDLFTSSKVNADLIVTNFKKAEKLIRKDDNFKDSLVTVLDIAKLFKDVIYKVRNSANQTEAKTIGKEVDDIFAQILDLNQDDEYIVLVTALYVGARLPKNDLDSILIAEKCERLYNTVIEILSPHHSREVFRTSAKMGQVVVDYLLHGKKINFSIKKQKPKWAKV